jgi:hypothetical protein
MALKIVALTADQKAEEATLRSVRSAAQKSANAARKAHEDYLHQLAGTKPSLIRNHLPELDASGNNLLVKE